MLKQNSGLDANAKTRMKDLQNKAKQSLNGTPSHKIYSTKVYKLQLITIVIYIIHRWNHTINGKKLLEEKYGELINIKPYNDDIGIADNKHQKFVKTTSRYI